MLSNIEAELKKSVYNIKSNLIYLDLLVFKFYLFLFLFAIVWSISFIFLIYKF